MSIVTFIDYTPEPREDGVSWAHARIEEAPAEAGPWTVIDMIDLVLDPDPSHPATRSFTTTNATIGYGGWYKVTWVDNFLNEQPTAPILFNAPLAWRPTLADVGTVDMARTRDTVGNLLGTFTDKTTPTDAQAEAQIDKAVDDLVPKIGTQIPGSLVNDVRDLVALRAAMRIELSFYGTEINTQRSPYPQLKAMFEDKLPGVVSAIEAQEAGADPSDALPTNSPAWTFPVDGGWLTRPM
jgi:hypothetical protein